jgi:cellulose synthase/poly-beta-1,6-N-acetylglucosamine synthase-like glycosyltransferase
VDSVVKGASKWAVGIVIPARDEEATIGGCIESVLAAARTGDEPFWLVVVADACADATATVARSSLASHGEVIECAAGSAGAARRIGVSAALAHFTCVETRSIWIANTDADSRVPQDWIRMHLTLADDGVTGVAGIIRLEENGCDEAHEVYRTTYRIAHDGSHTHVHGANMALRADAYLDVGGWSDVSVAEDHCLWGRLKARGWRVAAHASSAVITSARLVGRARGGFADTLRQAIDARCNASC